MKIEKLFSCLLIGSVLIIVLAVFNQRYIINTVTDYVQHAPTQLMATDANGKTTLVDVPGSRK